jgi:hypothetical protein
MLLISLLHISNDFFRDKIGNLQFITSTLSEEKGTQQFPLPVLASKVAESWMRTPSAFSSTTLIFFSHYLPRTILYL